MSTVSALEFQQQARPDPSRSAVQAGGGDAAHSAGIWHTNASCNDLRWPGKTRIGREVPLFLKDAPQIRLQL